MYADFETTVRFPSRKVFIARVGIPFRERPNLIAAEAFYIVAERGEEEADFAFLAVMHVHVEIGGLIARTGMDERGSFDF